MQGLLLLVFSRFQHLPFLRGVQTQSTRTGLGGCWVRAEHPLGPVRSFTLQPVQGAGCQTVARARFRAPPPARPVGWSVSGCVCRCVTFPCGVSIAHVCRRRSCSGAVSFSLRSVQQRAVWRSASLTQELQNRDSIMNPNDVADPRFDRFRG